MILKKALIIGVSGQDGAYLARLLLQKENPNVPFFYWYIIFEDIMKKVSFRIAPISDFDTEEMIQEINIFFLR